MQKISSEPNVAQKWSAKKMEGGDAWRTVECLRGRLQAERVASRDAKQETEHLENKLIKLEAQLKEEMKSRKRAEKKLRFLTKKVEALNISSYVSDDSNRSASLQKSDITSVSSSTASSETNNAPNLDVSKITTSSKNRADETSSCVTGAGSGELETPICDFEESIEKAKSSTGSYNFEQNLFGSTASSQGSHYPGMEDTSSGCGNESITDDHSLKAQNVEEGVRGDSYKSDEDDDDDDDDVVDNSMALVPVLDLPKEEQQSIDPAVLDATVKEVLNALQSAKDKLQRSMEQRRMVKLGLDRFLCALNTMY